MDAWNVVGLGQKASYSCEREVSLPVACSLHCRIQQAKVVEAEAARIVTLVILK